MLPLSDWLAGAGSAIITLPLLLAACLWLSSRRAALPAAAPRAARARAPKACDAPLPYGTRVKIKGLKARGDLNGRFARVVAIDGNSGRYRVELENLPSEPRWQETIVRIQRPNIRRVKAARVCDGDGVVSGVTNPSPTMQPSEAEEETARAAEARGRLRAAASKRAPSMARRSRSRSPSSRST